MRVGEKPDWIDNQAEVSEEMSPRTAFTHQSLTRFPSQLLAEIVEERAAFTRRAAEQNGVPIHPTRLVTELQALLSADITLCLDMGSFHIWLARYLYSFRARQILMTNGQQTLGVGLPWAIAACLVRPNDKDRKSVV